MSMIPFFPSLRPAKFFDLSTPINEEAEVLKYEREHHAWLDSIKNAPAPCPFGKVLTMPGPETDDEDANDDTDSDSHEEEDDDTNDRIIPGQPERSGLGLYSPPLGEDVNLSDEIATGNGIGN